MMRGLKVSNVELYRGADLLTDNAAIPVYIQHARRDWLEFRGDLDEAALRSCRAHADEYHATGMVGQVGHIPGQLPHALARIERVRLAPEVDLRILRRADQAVWLALVQGGQDVLRLR